MAADPRLARSVDPRRVHTPTQPPPPPPPPTSSDQKQVGELNGVDNKDNLARPDEGGFKLRFCTVCASNQNRYECFQRTTEIGIMQCLPLFTVNLSPSSWICRSIL